jgi:hypothetical protein
VLALAVVAGDPDGASVRVDDDDGVCPIGLARAAEILDGLAGAMSGRPWHDGYHPIDSVRDPGVMVWLVASVQRD